MTWMGFRTNVRFNDSRGDGRSGLGITACRPQQENCKIQLPLLFLFSPVSRFHHHYSCLLSQPPKEAKSSNPSGGSRTFLPPISALNPFAFFFSFSPPFKSQKIRLSLESERGKEEMIQPLFTLVAAEAAVVLLLLVKTPLRKLAIMGLDRVKRGRGPVMVKTIAATVFVVLVSSVYSIVKIQKRSDESGALTATDEILASRHFLEASLMELVTSYSLFLALIIDRLHHYMRELRMMRKSMEAAKKQTRGFDDGKGGGSDEIKALEEEASGLKTRIKHLEAKLKAKEANEEEISGLKAKVKQLELEADTKEKEAKAAEANAVALRKQSEGFLLEYDRLLEDNQNLRNQLQSFDRRLSHSDSKKNM
ncbi:hypothetical protein ACLOJK_010999 [Asimina triloba]